MKKSGCKRMLLVFSMMASMCCLAGCSDDVDAEVADISVQYEHDESGTSENEGEHGGYSQAPPSGYYVNVYDGENYVTEYVPAGGGAAGSETAVSGEEFHISYEEYHNHVDSLQDQIVTGTHSGSGAGASSVSAGSEVR